jgi:altronate dehydratase
VNPAIVISAEDNVATALEPLEAGQTIRAGAAVCAVTEHIPRGHKVALRAIRAGEIVVKYGSAIGHASADIAAGAHVHTHNVASARGRGDLAAPAPDAARIAEPPDDNDRDTREPSGGGPAAGRR